MAALEAVLEAVRARIEGETALVRSLEVDTIRNLADHLQPGSFAAWPTRSDSTRDARLNDQIVLVEDTIEVEIANRLRTAAQVDSFDTMLTTSRAVRVALTAPAWYKANGIMCLEWLSERRQRREGWVIVVQSYRLRRQMEIG